MTRLILSALLLLVAAAPSSAHFIFVVPQEGGKSASVVMSETLEPDEDVDVKLVAAAKLTLERPGDAPAPLALGEAAGHAYRVALPGEGTRVVRGSYVFGVRQRAGGKGFLIAYHPKAVVGDAFAAKTQGPAGATPAAEIVPVEQGDKFALRVLGAGKPAAGAEVTMLLPGGEEKTVATGADGHTPAFPRGGRYGAWARVVEAKSGEHDGKAYEEIRHYPTIVIDVPAAAKAAQGAADGDAAVAAAAALPEAASSFGAVAAGDHLYVYGGHTAKTHSYDTSAVSGRFHRLTLAAAGESKDAAWETLPGGPGLQGMNLASHGGRVYRIGGMSPRNAPGTKADVHSVADCTAFDPAAGRWSPLPALPEARSSHDVVVIGTRLYVVGGWRLTGSTKKAAWPEHGLSMDLASSQPAWEPFPQPFRRRALIAAAHGGKLYVIGGFDEDDAPSLDVNVYDPATKTWAAAAALPGPSKNGFGPAACVAGGRLYASVADGSLYRLNESAGQWDRVARTTPRIVHRLVPSGDRILVIGGADKGQNFDLVEAVNVAALAATAGGATGPSDNAAAASSREPAAP